MTVGTGVADPMAAALAAAALARIDLAGVPAVLRLYGDPRPAYGAAPGSAVLVAQMPLNLPCGTVGTNALDLSVPTTGALALVAVAPTWARLHDGAGVWLMDFRARLVTVPDDPLDPAVVVVQAGAIEAGALLRVTVGSIAFSG